MEFVSGSRGRTPSAPNDFAGVIYDSGRCSGLVHDGRPPQPRGPRRSSRSRLATSFNSYVPSLLPVCAYNGTCGPFGDAGESLSAPSTTAGATSSRFCNGRCGCGGMDGNASPCCGIIRDLGATRFICGGIDDSTGRFRVQLRQSGSFRIRIQIKVRANFFFCESNPLNIDDRRRKKKNIFCHWHSKDYAVSRLIRVRERSQEG